MNQSLVTRCASREIRCDALLRYLSPMQVILTNDDGIEAPGLHALEQACQHWCQVVVVAPDRCYSSMSHHVQTALDIPVKEIANGRFQVAGSPADCARLARFVLAPEAQWLISGINRGGNLGMDTCYSGTVAAAREAALLGLPAIAISHYVARGREVDWAIASMRAAGVIHQLFSKPLSPGEFWNVNLPHPDEGALEPELVMCSLDPSPLPVSFRKVGDGYSYTGNYQARARLPQHDVAECFGGRITATRLSATGGF